MADVAHQLAGMGVDHWASAFIVVQLGAAGTGIVVHRVVIAYRKSREIVAKVTHRHHDDVH